MPKEIRFGELVKSSGKPEIVSLWTDPKEDRSFMKAVKENRVLTLSQEPTSKKKDFGRIGFHQEPYASYLVFPKPLPKGDAPRVIGIKYELVEQPSVADPVGLAEKKTQPATTKRKPERQKPKFEVLIRRTVVIETSLTIENISSQKEARQKALQSIKAEPFDPTKAVIRNEVLSIQRARRD